MRLTTAGDFARCPIAQQWEGALRDLVIRHPDPRSTVELELTADAPPRLLFRLDVAFDTTNPSREMRPLNVSTVRLHYFPGTRVARMWVAAAWTGYLMHELLELVTIGDLTTRPIDPHANPDQDKCIRDGLPTELTPETLRTALLVVMRPDLVAMELGA
jgi:hypothetical protein